MFCSVLNYYYTFNSLTLFWLAESVQWIFDISVRDVTTADYTIIMSRTLKVTGYHVMYDRKAWFPVGYVKFARFVLLAVSEEAKTWLQFVFVQCIIKELLHSVFVISQKPNLIIVYYSIRFLWYPQHAIEVVVWVPASADNPYLDLDYSGYYWKTESNNCFIIHWTK